MMKAYDINFGVKLRVQEDGGAVEIEMEPTKKVSIKFIFISFSSLFNVQLL